MLANSIRSLSISVLLLGVSHGSSDEPLEWRWKDEKASLEYCIKRHLPDFDLKKVRVDEVEDFDYAVKILTKNDRKVIYSFGHSRREDVVFTRFQDTLFIAEYCWICTGCSVVSLDLKTGKRNWRSPLQGIGPTGHNKYSNMVNIDTDGKRVIVHGWELNGRYVEHLDISTGKTLANRKFPPRPIDN